MRLKTNSAAEFTQTIEKEVSPCFGSKKGFQDEITFIGQDAREAVAISFWDTQENAETYSRISYPDVAKALVKVVDGTPQVQIW
jgi:hypothetical protein